MLSPSATRLQHFMQRPAMRRVRSFVERWLQEVAWLLEYEPTWFPEFGFAVGAVGWGLGAMLTDDIVVTGWAWMLPCLAVVGGIARGFILLRLWYGARVVFAGLGALLWAWIWWGLAGRYGALPMLGPLAGVFVVEMLTAAKFTIPCARELLAEYQGSHVHR